MTIASVKFLSVHYPPDKNGPRALLAYTGLARLPDGTQMGEWIRETLRGEVETFDQSMRHLLNRANRDLARLKRPLIINALVVHESGRYIGGISNVAKESNLLWPEFEYSLDRVDKPFVFGNGSGGLLGCVVGTIVASAYRRGRYLSRARRWRSR